MLLSEAIEAVCIATSSDGRSPRNAQSYHEKLVHLLAHVGDVDVAEVTTDHLRRFVAEMYDTELSPFTVASRARAFERLFAWLVTPRDRNEVAQHGGQAGLISVLDKDAAKLY